MHFIGGRVNRDAGGGTYNCRRWMAGDVTVCRGSADPSAVITAIDSTIGMAEGTIVSG